MSAYRNKVCVVTGAGSGIGRALAAQLAGAGARLALSDIDEQGLEATREMLPETATCAPTSSTSRRTTPCSPTRTRCSTISVRPITCSTTRA